MTMTMMTTMNRTCVMPPAWCLVDSITDALAPLRRAYEAILGWVRPARVAPPETDIRVATYAVLLELLYADQGPTLDQRRRLEATLRRQFGVGMRQSAALLRRADTVRAKDGVARVTRQVAETYSEAQKLHLVEIMRSLVGLDGVVTSTEAYLMRKLVALLRVDAGWSSASLMAGD